MPRDARQAFDRLFLAAARLDPAERSAFLEGLSAEDREVGEEVRRRLEAAPEPPESFLRPPATELLKAACEETVEEATPLSGNERYEIGECLGTGGMARVYRVFDRLLGRPVALKILHATGLETPRRLLHEARAQARVRHEHVLEVYDTGELDDRPYIAVRYVAGGSLADWIAPDPAVGLEKKVRLAAQAAEGLHAAHREGLLHGDVKPSNVLVEETPDGDLAAWICDFGLASEIAEGDHRPGALAGTPEYMAPELLAGEHTAPDRRSDVFSLGVTLHQLLTGELPPRAAVGWSDLRRRAPELPADLAAIVARCLAEDPDQRYPSARAVAEELRRYLDGEVVQAHADRLAYRLTRFVSRHRTLLAVSGIAALLLAGALAVAAAMGVRAVRANDRADRRREQAEGLIQFMLVDLRDKLQAVGRLDLLDDVGKRAMGYFAAVPEPELSDQELARRSTALYQIGDVRLRRGDLAGAQQPFEESLALARQLAERHPDDPERLFGLGQSEFWAGYALWKRGELAGARRHFEAYDDVSRRLVARDPANLEWRRELSYAESNLGSVLEAQGDLPAALTRFEHVLEIDRRLASEARDPKRADDRRFDLAVSHNLVGRVLERMGRLREARKQYEADLALRRQLVAGDPLNQRWKEYLGTSQEYLGNLLLTCGEAAEARPHLEAAHDLFGELARLDSDNGDWRYKRAWSALWLGRLEWAEGRRAAARADWLQADGIARDLAAIDPGHVDWQRLLGVARYHLARVRPGDRAAAARPEVDRAVEALDPLAAARPRDRRTHRWLAEALLLRGDLEMEAGASSAARRAWSRALQTLAPFTAPGPGDPALLALRAEALARLGRGREATDARAALEAMGASGLVAPPSLFERRRS